MDGEVRVIVVFGRVPGLLLSKQQSFYGCFQGIGRSPSTCLALIWTVWGWRDRRIYQKGRQDQRSSYEIWPRHTLWRVSRPADPWDCYEVPCDWMGWELSGCVSHYFHYCVQIPSKREPKVGSVYFSSYFRRQVHHSRGDRATRAGWGVVVMFKAVCSRLVGSRSRDRAGTHFKGSTTSTDSAISWKPNVQPWA